MTEIKQILIDREVPCTVRDGVTLYANVYRPSEAGKYPILLSRLPYNKNLPDFSHRYIDPIKLAMEGYAVIIQDVRGRFASEGEFEPFAQEGKDGFDTVEWAARLPYSNGKVGMFGLSYYAFTQLYAMMERPPSLKAIFPAMTGNIFKEAFGKNGVMELAAAETWVLDSIAPDYLKRKQGSEYAETIKEIKSDLNKIEQWHTYTPFKEWPPVMKHPELREIYSTYIKQEFNKKALSNASYKDLGVIDLPAYHLAGWYDNFLGQTLLNYEQMSESNTNQKLIIGPWGHGMFHSELGERSFGIDSAGTSIDGKDDITSLHIQWFNHWLKEDKESPANSEDPVKIFVMGTNEWRSEKEWPLKRTENTPYYFHSDGRSNIDLSSGSLTTVPPEDERHDQYTHDPENPVPTNGGGVLFYNGRGAGPYDQKEIEKRDDVLVYTTEPLVMPLEVTGWIKVVLWASTDAKDTDFTAKLVDVFPDGRAYNLTDGIIRAKYRYDKEVQPGLTGEVVKYEIDLWATSNVFLPGHSIRIEIASSDFPRYDVNPNTGKTTADTVDMVKATQKIYHQREYPSHVLLPIVPN
ncbi:CocE/NonD family hydrolase [Virgibacillus sp. C22-A2]|uniref:CocE/NonD family hydrolase n=1 Tax=Virgibacillus tibetensis TaxID=3042313 RepID=A0ABU6KET3_9BACI|nr:CocE/NonD family hydrolase [Virgibacillus sp. C22-A2]